MDLLAEKAYEEGRFGIQIVLTTYDGSSLPPATATWSLTKIDGTVINSRDDVAISSPTATIQIGLEGDDLAVDETGEDYVRRVLTLKGTHNQALFGGAGAKFKYQVAFDIEAMVNVS
jgi:hypothetical protein